MSVIANYELSHGQWTGLVEVITEPCLNLDPVIREVGYIRGMPCLMVEVACVLSTERNVDCKLCHG